MAVPCENRLSPPRPPSNRSASRSAHRGPPDAGPSSISRIAQATPPGRPRAASRAADRDRAGTHAQTDRCWRPDGRLSYPYSNCLLPLPAVAMRWFRLTVARILQTSPGLSPLAFCDLNAPDLLNPGFFQMPTPTPATASSDDPALLRIEGPIATITLNRPGAFNSIDLSIAKKMQPRGAEAEANHDIRVLVIEGEARPFSAGGDLQTIGAAAAADTIAPVVGEL